MKTIGCIAIVVAGACLMAADRPTPKKLLLRLDVLDQRLPNEVITQEIHVRQHEDFKVVTSITGIRVTVEGRVGTKEDGKYPLKLSVGTYLEPTEKEPHPYTMSHTYSKVLVKPVLELITAPRLEPGVHVNPSIQEL